MALNTIIIASENDLDNLLSGLKPPFRIKLDLPRLQGLQADLAQERLSKLASPCGCKEGAIGLLIGIGFTIASLGFSTKWPLWLLIIVTGTFLGKLIGLSRGKKALSTEISRLKQFV